MTDNTMPDLPDNYFEQPIVDALRACATGEFATWTLEQHEALSFWINKYPHAIAHAAARYLDEQLPDSVRAQFGSERSRSAPKLVLVHGCLFTKPGTDLGESAGSECTDDNLADDIPF